MKKLLIFFLALVVSFIVGGLNEAHAYSDGAGLRVRVKDTNNNWVSGVSVEIWNNNITTQYNAFKDGAYFDSSGVLHGGTEYRNCKSDAVVQMNYPGGVAIWTVRNSVFHPKYFGDNNTVNGKVVWTTKADGFIKEAGTDKEILGGGLNYTGVYATSCSCGGYVASITIPSGYAYDSATYFNDLGQTYNISSAVAGDGRREIGGLVVENGKTKQLTVTLRSTTSVNGSCKSPPDGNTYDTAPTGQLCSSGSASAIRGSGPWYWDCLGLNGGTDKLDCHADKPPTIFNACPTLDVSPTSVKQGKPVTLSWGGGNNVKSINIKQKPAGSDPTLATVFYPIAEGTSKINGGTLEMVPSASMDYILEATFKSGAPATCATAYVPVTVNSVQSGSDRPVPPN